MLFFICVLAILLNFDFFSYNEIFLLAIFLIIFFNLIYFFAEFKFKQYIFFQIYKVYCLIFVVLRLSSFFQKLSIFIYLMKKRLLKKLNFKTWAVKKGIMIIISKLLEDYWVILCFLFFLNISKKLKLLSNNLNILLIFTIDKINSNDNLFFY